MTFPLTKKKPKYKENDSQHLRSLYISSGFNKEILFYEKLKYLGRSRKPQSGKQFFAVATLKVISLLSKERKIQEYRNSSYFSLSYKSLKNFTKLKKAPKLPLKPFSVVAHARLFSYVLVSAICSVSLINFFLLSRKFFINFNETAEKCTESLGKMVPIEFYHFFSKCKRIASFSLQVWVQQVKEPCKFTMKIIFARVNKF